MAIMESVGRLASTFVSIIQTRLELAAVEMEQESRRLLSYLLLSLLALFFVAMALVLLSFLVVLLFWDTHRIAAVLGLTGLYAALGLMLGLGVRNSFANKPRLLSYTIAELHKDLDSVKGAVHHSGS